jgi:glycosyltransferase involved in cell wall biosynthesis
MNILFNTYPTAFDVPGGGEMQIMAYKKHLPDYGIKPTLYNLWNPNLDLFQIVHYFSVTSGSIPFCQHMKTLKKPLIINSSIWLDKDNAKKFPPVEIGELLSLADSIIVNSNIEGETLSSIFNLPKNKFCTVYNGVDDCFLTPTDPKIAIQSFSGIEKYLLHVGTIEPRKNQLSLIRAAKQFPNHKVVLIGYVRDREYAKLCLDEGGDRVLFVGPIPHDSELLRSAMSGCDAFVVPGFSETPSLAALEAAAQGASIAITNIGSAPEYFDNLVSYLDPNSLDSIEEAIAKAIQLPKNNKLRSLILEKYTWQKVLNPLVAEYHKWGKI